MSTRRIRADLLVGRKVRDAGGRVVGRIEEMRAEVVAPGAGDYVVSEFVLGTGGAIEKIMGRQLAALLRRWMGLAPRERVVSWRELDLSDAAAPRLRGSR